jgi:hypothetical protein
MPPFGIGPGPGTIHKGEALIKVNDFLRPLSS